MRPITRLLPLLISGIILCCGKDNPTPVTPNPNPNPNPTVTAPTLDNTATTSSDITATTAKVSSTITANGGSAITQHGHVWSETNATPTVADTKTELGITSGSFPLKFTSELKNLKANTTYNVRAYAVNGKGTTYGTATQVKTAAEPIIINNKDAKVIIIMDSYQLYAVNASNQNRLWTKIRIGGSSYGASTLDNTTAYVCWNNTTEAYDIQTGVKKWEFVNSNNTSEYFFTTPLIYNDLLVVGSVGSVLYALDLKTGQKKWEFKTASSSSISSPTIVDDVLFYGSNHIYALNPNTGTQIWRFTLPSGTGSSPAVSGGMVYVGANNGLVYGIDAKAGTKKWEFKTGGFFIASSPTVENNVVYIGGNDDKKVYALDAGTGVKKWEFLTGGNVLSSPWIENNILYVGSNDKKLYALDANTGVKKWDFLMNLENTAPNTSPVIVNGTLYMSSNYDKKLYALNATTGSKIWESIFRDLLISSPAILTNDGKTILSGISGTRQ